MYERVDRVMKRVLDVNDGDISTDLARNDVQKWDSLSHMDLIASLEKEFNVRLSIDDIIKMDRLSTIRTVILEKTGHNEGD